MKLPAVVASLALFALAPRLVQAEPHRLCLQLDLGPGFWDASPRAADGKSFHEEYGRNEGPAGFPAQRWLARVHDETADEVVFGWQTLDGSGCADFEISGDTDLTVEWLRWAVWDGEVATGNHLVGYECNAAMGHCDLVFPTVRVLPANTETGVTEVVITAVEARAIDHVFWAASFAEERFASVGEQPLTNARIYVSYDPADVLPGATQADRTFGNQPSVILDAESWHSKFTIAHELGHQQTLVASNPTFACGQLDYCYDPAVYPAAPVDCSPNHTMTSYEWQAAAAVEGAAHWYAVAVWNDLDIIDCPTCQPGLRYVSPTAPDQAETYAIPRATARCNTIGEDPCPAGVGNEWDWASAFRRFQQSDSAPSLRTTLTMLSAAYGTGNWIANGASDAFWHRFDRAMVGHLGAQYPGWDDASRQMELNR